MAGGQERELRRRIRSVQSTKKITRAMELIAATRVAKAQQRAAAARPYSENLTGVIQHLAERGDVTDHPLLVKPVETKKVAYVIISSDRGLAGGYNSTVIKAAEREIDARRNEGADYSLILIGRKAESYFRFRNYRIDATFNGISDNPSYADAEKVGQVVADQFETGEVQEVVLVYTRFISMGNQQASVREFMPLTGVGAEASDEERAQASYEFEPEPTTILENLLPRYVTARLYAALLDSAASEHASRQRAMKAATDNAEELIVKLSRIMNRARQDAITTEITEIVGGAEALQKSGGSSEHDAGPHENPFDPALSGSASTHHQSAGEQL